MYHTLPQINPNKEKYLAEVRAQIVILRTKAESFNPKRNVRALTDYGMWEQLNTPYQAAKTLADDISRLTDQYARDEISLNVYKERANGYFDEKNLNIRQLRTHRGIKEIAVNLLAAIVGNVLFLGAALLAGTFRVFKPETDSAKKVSALAYAVKDVRDEQTEITGRDLVPSLSKI